MKIKEEKDVDSRWPQRDEIVVPGGKRGLSGGKRGCVPDPAGRVCRKSCKIQSVIYRRG